MASRASIDAFLAHPALALVGMSRSGKKFGNLAFRELVAKGYRVYPIHPAAETIEGTRCYQRLADLPEPVDAALVVVPPAEALSTVRQAAAAGIHHLWLQQGAESPEVLEACRELGVDAVAGECVLMFAQPAGYHKVHRWIWRMLGKLPN
jgi:hypothetical protein